MIEVLKQALEALKDVGVLTDREWQAVHKNKANELRQAIAELESQEPFCYVYKENGEDFFAPKDGYYPADAKPLYTHPPQRTEQEPVAWMDADGNVSDNNDHKCFPIPLYTHPPQHTEERNFCPRCGKRTNDIHTCTPPMEKNNG